MVADTPDALEESFDSAGPLALDLNTALVKVAGDAQKFRLVAKRAEFINQDAATAFAN